MVQDSSLRAQAQKVKDLTAFHHRDEGYHLIAVALWDDPGDDEKNSRCARKAWNGMQPFALEGVYVDGMGDEDESQAPGVSAYGVKTRKRLVTLKKNCVATNFFNLDPYFKPAE